MEGLGLVWFQCFFLFFFPYWAEHVHHKAICPGWRLKFCEPGHRCHDSGGTFTGFYHHQHESEYLLKMVETTTVHHFFSFFFFFVKAGRQLDPVFQQTGASKSKKKKAVLSWDLGSFSEARPVSNRSLEMNKDQWHTSLNFVFLVCLGCFLPCQTELTYRTQKTSDALILFCLEISLWVLKFAPIRGWRMTGDVLKF